MAAARMLKPGIRPKTVAAQILSREAAVAWIANRLAELDHPPDLLDSGAIGALVDHAGGSPVRLRAALAATLFLASTEDAPAIDRALVRRALQEGERRPIPGSPAREVHGRVWRLGGAALAGAAMLALYVLMMPQRGVQPAPVAPELPPAAAPSRPSSPAHYETVTSPVSQAKSGAGQVPAAKPPAESKHSPVPAAAPPVKALPDLPPAVEVGALPVPPAPGARHRHTASAGAPTLPAAPAALVLLLYPARDQGALHRLDALTRLLRRAGVAQLETSPVYLARPRRPVTYFYAEDLALAERVAASLVDGGWPRLSRNSLAPRLVLPPAGLPARRPGTIEVQLP